MAIADSAGRVAVFCYASCTHNVRMYFLFFVFSTFDSSVQMREMRKYVMGEEQR